MALSRTVRGARIESLIQCRVTPATIYEKKKLFGKKEWSFNRILPVHLDSSLVFPSEEDAMSYFPVFIKSLAEMELLIPQQPYETSLVTLTMFDKALE